jgi:predicted RNase H-like nuclease
VTRVLGVDGARDGWQGALVESGTVVWLRLRDVDEVLAVDADAIGIDMPIGLPESGRRECDLLAKRALGAAHSRVFLAPPRGVLSAPDYAAAGRRHRELASGAGLSLQTWHLVRRIREVDARADDARLVEVHPELSFALLAGAVLPRKHDAAGRGRRLAALRSWLPSLEPASVPRGHDAPDALVAAWSAARWLARVARTLPARPPSDARGRPMRIVS